MEIKVIDDVIYVHGDYTKKYSFASKVKKFFVRRFWKSVFMVEVIMFFVAGLFSANVLLMH